MTLPYKSTPNFQQIFNFSDLGGHLAGTCSQTRPGVLFRSAELSDATLADIKALASQLGVRTLIDLRRPKECSLFPIPQYWHGTLVNLPLFEESDDPLPFARLGDAYVDFLRRSHIGSRLVEVLSLLVEKGTLPAVFFCGAGKDRTGLVTAAILSAIGVGNEVIIDDYIKSADFLEGV